MISDPNALEFQEHILKVNTSFYEFIYKDEWFKQVFCNVAQDVITRQQTDFIIQAFGGPSNYCGRMPADAHPHIFVDEHMWQLREDYLIDAFKINNTPEEIRIKWLKIDNAFKNAIVKKSVDDCKKRFNSDDIIFVDSKLDPRYTEKFKKAS